jgi:hypothetical protein
LKEEAIPQGANEVVVSLQAPFEVEGFILHI